MIVEDSLFHMFLQVEIENSRKSKQLQLFSYDLRSNFFQGYVGRRFIELVITVLLACDSL